MRNGKTVADVAAGRVWMILLSLGLLATGTARADSLALFSGAGQSGLGGSAATSPLVVTVRDVDGVPVAGRSIQWSAGNGFQLSAPSSVTDANGHASIGFTYGNYGTTNIVATDAVGGTSAQAPETAIGSDSIVLISGGGQTGAAGSSSAQPLVVEVRNAAGVPVAGRSISWTDQTALTQVAAPTSVTNTSGRASMNFTYLQGPFSLLGTSAAIRATDASNGKFVDANAITLGVPHLILQSADTISGLIGSTSAPIVVKLVNFDNTPLAGATVTWADRFPGGNVSLSAASTVTDSNGLTSITVTFVGNAAPPDGDIEATYLVSNVDVPYTSVGGGSITLVSAEGMSGAPSSVSPTPIVVEIRNGDGSLAVGSTVNWTTSLGDAVASSPTTVTDALGRASTGFTFGTVVSNIRATEASTGRTLQTRLEVTPSDSLRIVSGEGQIGTAATPAAAPIVVEVLDSNGNPVSGRTINWSVTQQDADGVALASASTVTDATGRSSNSFTYKLAGRSQITAQDPVSFRGVNVRVAAVGMNTFTVVSGNDQTGLPNTHSVQPLVAELRDGNGQPVVGATVNWQPDCTAPAPACDAVLDSTSSVTDAQGRVSMGFTFNSVAGYSSWEADDPQTRARAEFNIYTIGADTLTVVSGNGQSGLVSAPGAQPMVVEVRNASGAVVAGRTINWSTSVPAGAAVANAATSVTDAAGRASMAFTYGTGAIASTLVANDGVTLQEVQFAMTAFQAGDTATIISGDGQAGLPGSAGAQPIVVEFRDGNNQPKVGMPVNWSVASGPATLGAVISSTDANGRASAAFNYGATAGASLIEARDATSPNGQRMQASVTSLGNNQALSVISGDGQALVANAPSAPLVVELRNFAGQPVAGAAINWSTDNGAMAATSTVTDAQGRASNTVTPAQSGAVNVSANSTLAGSAATFSMNTGLATLPNLTPEEAAVAVAIDNACPALANQSTLSPGEADLLARCQELMAAASLDPTATATALSEMLVDTAQAQASAAVVAVGAQFQNIKTRLMALRSGSTTSSLAGLTFTGSGGMIPLASFGAMLLGDDSSPAGAAAQPSGFSRWGFFAAGNIGRGEADERSNTPAYDYDIEGLTAGVDYRQRDNLVIGAAVGLTRQDTDLRNDEGDVALRGWSISGYSTWSFKDTWYLDGVLTYGSNRFNLHRHIGYSLPLPGGGSTVVDQIASGEPDGTLLSGALTFGGDFHHEAWNFSPYGQVVSSKLDFDGYDETLRAGPGSGLGMAVAAREVHSLTGILGARVSYSASMDWGVLVPTVSAEWNHEFRDELDAVSAHFLNDPTRTQFALAGEPTDSDYMRLGVGLSLVMSHGRSGFFLYDRMEGRDGQAQENFSLGIRIEF